MGALLPILNALAVSQGVGFLDFPGTGAWRPPQWGKPALTSISVPSPQSSPSLITDPFGNSLPSAPSAPILYVFDAVLHIDHESAVRRTEHPVQTGANISDHAYALPKRIVIEIGMSDAMDSYSPGAWTSNDSKSVSAYQTMLDFQSQRTLCTVTTRLMTYANMLITGVAAPDDARTLYGLRARITFEEVILATVTSVSSSITYGGEVSGVDESARPQTTDRTSVGTVQAAPVSAALKATHNVSSTAYWSIPRVIPGAGTWSSLNLSGLNNLIPSLNLTP